jgi:hypothetical protein
MVSAAVGSSGCALEPGAESSSPAPSPSVERAAITNGAADPGDPAVAALVDANGLADCTATLVAPHSLLTAAHCVAGQPFSSLHVVFGADVASGQSFELAGALVHPQFDPSTLADDAALVTTRLAAPAAPLPLDPRTLDASLVGQTFTAVGFGSTSAAANDGGHKRSGTSRVTQVAAASFTAAPSPSQACGGDSGGPALFTVSGTTYVSGVTSHGDGPCVDHAVYQRVDVIAPFIQTYLQSVAPGVAKTGDRCLFAEECAGGACLVAADDATLSFCSQPCRAKSDCPGAMICAPDGCRWPAPSPGALGAACAQPADCASGDCHVAGSAGVCARPCVPNGQDCPARFVCTNTVAIQFECLPAPPSGCAFARARSANGGGAGPGALAAVAALWLVLVACARAHNGRTRAWRSFANRALKTRSRS